MTDRHLDDGIIQAYIDGELSQEDAAAAVSHLAACEECSAAAASAEGELSFFAAAFAPDEAVTVPTADLRARLNAAVARLEATAETGDERARGRSLGGFLASFSGLFNFTPRAAGAFATLLVAAAAGIIYLSSQKSEQPPAGALVARTETPAPAPAPAVTTTPEAVAPAPVATPDKADKVEKADRVGRPDRGARVQSAGHNRSSAKGRPEVSPTPKEEALPGEKEYRTAIASLEKTIKAGGDESLRPAVRADYERNIALLDSAIEQTRQVAAQNPKDKDAVGFLMAAYQSKVELLTRVADQAQVAALGR